MSPGQKNTDTAAAAAAAAAAATNTQTCHHHRLRAKPNERAAQHRAEHRHRRYKRSRRHTAQQIARRLPGGETNPVSKFVSPPGNSKRFHTTCWRVGLCPPSFSHRDFGGQDIRPKAHTRTTRSCDIFFKPCSSCVGGLSVLKSGHQSSTANNVNDAKRIAALLVYNVSSAPPAPNGSAPSGITDMMKCVCGTMGLLPGVLSGVLPGVPLDGVLDWELR